MKAKKYLCLPMFLLAGLTSCDGMLDIDPPTDSYTAETVYGSEESIEALAEGLYSANFGDMFYLIWQELFGGFCADELLCRSTSYDDFVQNVYNPNTGNLSSFWTKPYSTIYHCNDFIIHVEPSTLISEAKKKVCLGEAHFFRAYSYFLLVNFFGDVPLVLTNNYEESRLLPRTAKETVYETIVDDLQKAVVYLDGSDNPNTKVTAEAATAMLARVYLYIGQWDAAAKEAGKLIPVADGGTGTKFVLEDDVNDVFLKTTREGILNLDCTNRNGDGSFQKSTMIGMFFVSASQNPTYYLSDELVADLQEDPKDLRGQNWIKCVEKDGVKGKYFPYKNKYSNDASVPSGREEYEPFLRLAEQYLIRAEARVHLKDYTGAVSDLNRIRSRAGVEPLPAMTDENKLLLAVEEERRKELFFERGHRWFDLNRTGRADAIYSKVSYKQWVPEASLWPIPESEMKANRYLEQNLGY